MVAEVSEDIIRLQAGELVGTVMHMVRLVVVQATRGRVLYREVKFS